MSDHASIHNLLSRLESWLKSNAPSCLSGLQPGASTEAISTLEEDLGVTFPTDVRTFFGWRQAQSSLCDELDFVWPFGSSLLTLGEVKLETLSYRDVDPDLEPYWWRPLWIPLIGGQNNRLCLDLEGSITGNVGQLIFWQKYEDHRFVVARSFSSYLEMVVESLEAGLWACDEFLVEPKDWDAFDAFSESYDVDDCVSFDLNGGLPEELPVEAPRVHPQADLIGLIEAVWTEAKELLGQGRFQDVLDLTQSLETCPQGLRNEWYSLALVRAEALLGLGDLQSFHVLTVQMEKMYLSRLLERYWALLLEAGPISASAQAQRVFEQSVLESDIPAKALTAGAVSWRYDTPERLFGSFPMHVESGAWLVELCYAGPPSAVNLEWIQILPSPAAMLPSLQQIRV